MKIVSATLRFSRDADGFAATEFALALPVLLLMMLGFVELDRYAWATRQMETTATSIAQMLTQTGQGAGKGLLGATADVKPSDIEMARNSVQVLFPRVLADSARLKHKWSDDIAVGISSVSFKELNPGCVGPACKYEATVAWSGGNARRPCKIALTEKPNTEPPSATTLPSDAFGPNSIVVVDLTYAYKPLFAEKIFSGFTLKRSAYLQPRYVSELKYAVAKGDSLVTTCA